MKKLLSAVIIGTMSLSAVACAKADEKKGQSVSIAFDVAQGCTPRNSEANAGTLTIVAKNDGKKAGELEILDGDRVMGEAENILPGAEKKFSLKLDEGNYTVYCGKKSTEQGTLKVGPATDS